MKLIVLVELKHKARLIFLDTSFRNKANFQLEGQEDDACNKDTGSVMKLRRWSRGIFAIVPGGGHIKMFASLFNSESPTQVAMILLSFLCEILKDTDPQLWKKKFLRDAFQKSFKFIKLFEAMMMKA